jgi:putative flippase GtrA
MGSMGSCVSLLKKFFSEKPDFLIFSKFSIIGIFNTVLGLILYAIFLQYTSYVGALFLSHIICVLNSYVWNKKWAFKSNKSIFIEFIKFYSVYAVALVLNIISLYILINYFEISELMSQVISTPIITIITYLLHKHWSFK